MRNPRFKSLIFGFLLCQSVAGRGGESPSVDFRYSPPQWQTSICLPDDPEKSLVDKSGQLLYHYGQGGREFGTRIGVRVADGLEWRKQQLISARAPIVRTYRSGSALEVVEEAFAVTRLSSQPKPGLLRRTDPGTVIWNWAEPPADSDVSLRHIAVHMGGGISYELDVPGGEARLIALALCEGWWGEPGKRVQALRVEGAPPRKVDMVAEFGKNKPAIFWFEGKDTNGDGKIDILVEPAPEGSDKNSFLNGIWAFRPGEKPEEKSVLTGRSPVQPLARLNLKERGGPARNDLILVTVTNSSHEPRRLNPQVIVDTTLGCIPEPDLRHVQIGQHEMISSSLKMIGHAEEQKNQHVIRLDTIELPAGGSTEFFVLYCGGGALVNEPSDLAAARVCRQEALAYWQNAPLPFGRVQVPDPGVQDLVDSSIRNIWQAREIRNGLPVFQVGPTCYRGLWIVDGAFLLEAAAMLGAGKEARSGLTYTLSQQKPSGAFEVLDPRYYKENGIVIWTCVRHAMLTQDKAWLASVWPQLERSAEYIEALRRQSLEDDTLLDDGLNPPGEIDGGLSGHGSGFKRPEFSNVHWNLAGLHTLVQAARWLGREDTARKWQAHYEDLYAAFRRAAERDKMKDGRGNSYVPIFMANAGNELPQRAQWSFCHAVYPGQVFPGADPLVTGTLAMLRATEREGMVYGTGWDATGIWNYFASFYGHAWLWQGEGRKAGAVLNAFANHASPTLVWREEQSLRGEPFKKVGDMPHNWASAEFIRLTVHLLELDRGNELHLLEGLPPEWSRAGMTTRLSGIATPFGNLEMRVQVDSAGKSALLSVGPLSTSCSKIVVHLPQGGTRQLSPLKGGQIRFAVASGAASEPSGFRRR